MIRSYFHILLLLLPALAFSQEPCFIKLGYDQGLPSTEVFDLFQDNKGFIWIGHNNGISRYDGYEFKSFSNKNLSGKALSRLSDDAQCRIWCINFAGQICYVENDSLHILAEYEKLNEPNFALYEIDKQQNILYASSSKGLFIYTINTHKSRLISPPGLSKWNSRQMLLGADGALIVTTSDYGVWQYKNGQFEQLNTKGDELDIAANLFVIQTNPVILFDRSNNRFIKLQDKNIQHLKPNKPIGSLNTFCYVGSKNLINTSSGSFEFSFKKDSVIIKEFLRQQFISDIIKDKEDNYWVSTLNEGVLLSPDIRFTIFNSKNSVLQSDKLVSISNGPSGELYIGSSDGRIYHLNTNTQQFLNQTLLEQGRSVNKIVYDPEKNKLLAATNKTYMLDAANLKSELLNPQLLNHKDISLYHKVIIAANPIGLSIYNSGSLPADHWINQIIRNNEHSDLPHSFAASGLVMNGIGIGALAHCRRLHVDTSKHTIWACYSGGLKIYHSKGVYLPAFEHKPVFSRCVVQYGDYKIIGTIQNGLLVFKDTTFIMQITNLNGLLDNSIVSLKVHQDKLWILSNSGLQSLDASFKNYNTYTTEDGLIGNDFSDLIVDNNKVWITSGNGLISFPVNAPSINLTKPSLYLNYFKVNEENYITGKAIDLEPFQNNISIGFQSFSFLKGKGFKYKYRLLNEEAGKKPWITLDRQTNSLRFFSLSPGSYTFEVKAINEDQIESETRSVHFTILKPIYYRWWFILLFIVMIVLVISIAALWKINSIRRKSIQDTETALLEKNLTEARLSAIRAQMNPHFLFNALSSIQTLFLKNDQRKANQNLVKFSHLMRTILTMSNQQEITLAEEIEMLKLYLDIEIDRFDNQIKYDFIIDETIDPECILLPPLIIQPYLENIFKHAFPGKKDQKQIHIRMHLKDGELNVELEDNGWGRAYTEAQKKMRQSRHQSFAMNATQHRIDLINKNRIHPIEIKVLDLTTNNAASGTLVIIRIPIENTNE